MLDCRSSLSADWAPTVNRMVANLARGGLNRDFFLLSPFAHENLVPRDRFDCPDSLQPAAHFPHPG